MSDLLLLKERNLCPKCFSRRARNYNGPCANCGMMLFVSPINFAQYESDGNSPEWWLFHSQNGWMHRSHVMNGARPNDRKIAELPTERVTKTAEQRIAEMRHHA